MEENNEFLPFESISQSPQELDYDHLINCPNCGKPIPQDATMCLYCGEPVDLTGGSNKNSLTRWLIVILLIILLLGWLLR
jgi:predicted nucleic acid-binding Zn ribbon protein